MSLRNQLENLHPDRLRAFVQDKFPHMRNGIEGWMTNGRIVNDLLVPTTVDDSAEARATTIKTELENWLRENPTARTYATIAVFILLDKTSMSADAQKEAMIEASAICKALARSRRGAAAIPLPRVVSSFAEVVSLLMDELPDVIHLCIQSDVFRAPESVPTRDSSVSHSARWKLTWADLLGKAYRLNEDGLPPRLLTVSGIRADEVANHLGDIPSCTIGLAGTTTAVAVKFFASLYQDIGNGHDVEKAYGRARIEIGILSAALYDLPARYESGRANATTSIFAPSRLPPLPKSWILGAFAVYLLVAAWVAGTVLENVR